VIYHDSAASIYSLAQGCVAVITPDTLDVLCHAAVRARNSSVLLASCSQPEALQDLRSLAGSHVSLTVSKVAETESEKLNKGSEVQALGSPGES
jgi:hypothetical protein